MLVIEGQQRLPDPRGLLPNTASIPIHRRFSVETDNMIPMADGRGISASIDELVDRAVLAINRGDRATATALAGQVLAIDHGNVDAEDLLLAAPGDGEIRRLTIAFADVVDSTVLSTRVEPETYRLMVGRYRDIVLRVVHRYEGHIASTKGDGLLAVFGHPTAHENDVRRAVQASLEITREVAHLSEQTRRRFGIQIAVRVGVHRGLVYLDTAQDDVYGLAANLAARVSGLAAPNSVAVSEPVAALVGNDFELEEQPAAPVKGVEGLVAHHRVLGERIERTRSGRGPLVGREREVTQLHKCWARAQTGTLTLPGLFFCGEPGIGKSRLAVEAAELVKHCGGAVLELSGSPFHTQVGLHPVRVLLERRCGISRLTDAAERLGLLEAEVIARGLDPVTTVPLLAPVLAIGPEHGYEPTAAEGRRLEELIASAIQRYLLACFDSAAGLLVAEDLQWFDQSTLELVGSMLGAGGARLLVVLTGRDAGQLPEDCRVSRFDLVPLSNDQTDSLIRSLDATVRDDQCAEVRRRCDGVPFYIEQLVAGLRTPSSDTSGVPDALYEPLFARLRAGENVVPVVEAAAVIGRQIDRSLLLAVVDLGGAQLDEVIGQLERARVLERSITDTWQFRHELLREVAIELAPPSVRQKLHAKVADALSQNVSGDPEWPVVAGHYERAGQPADAASAYQRASTAARRRGALGEARTYLTHAVTQLEQCPPGPDRDRREIAPRLERGYLTATAEGAGSPVAAADFERCLQLAGTDLRDDDLVAALTGVTVYYIWRADLSRVSQLLKLVRTAAEQGRQWFHPAIDFTSGIVAWLRGEFDTARAYLDQTTTGPAEAYDHQIQTLRFVPNDPVATAHQYLAWDRLVHGDVAGAEAQLACAMDRADQLGYPQGPYNRLYTIDMEIWVRTEAGQYDRARALVAELIEKSNRYGLDYLYWRMLGATEQALVEGRASLASDNPGSTGLSAQIENLTQIVDVWRAVGANTNRPFYCCLLGRLLDAAGRPDQARARLDAALESTAETGVRFYSAELLRARAHTFNEPDARAAELAAARELARSQGVPLFELRTALDDFDLRGEPARGGLVDAVERMPANTPLPELAQALALLG